MSWFSKKQDDDEQPKQDKEALPEKAQEVEREQEIDTIYQDENALYWCVSCGNLYRPCSHIRAWSN